MLYGENLVRVSVRITDNISKLRDSFGANLQKDIDNIIKTNSNSISKRIQDIVIDAISRTPEFISLGIYAQGSLAPEFGFPDGSSTQINLLTAIRESLNIKVFSPKLTKTRVPQNLIQIQLDQDKLLNSGVASYRSGRYRIGWLRWLLDNGTTPVVLDYYIEYNLNFAQKKLSRSGMALMVKKEGASYSVPSKYAGRSTNNFITRAIDEVYEEKIVAYLNRILL